MQTGKLDTQITIERKTVTQDSVYGTDLIAWVPLFLTDDDPPVPGRIWAEVEDALPSRAESVALGLPVAKNQTRIRFRFRDDIDESMRVIVHRDTDVTMQIVGGPAMVGGRKELTEIVCERYSS